MIGEWSSNGFSTEQENLLLHRASAVNIPKRTMANANFVLHYVVLLKESGPIALFPEGLDLSSEKCRGRSLLDSQSLG